MQKDCDGLPRSELIARIYRDWAWFDSEGYGVKTPPHDFRRVDIREVLRLAKPLRPRRPNFLVTCESSESRTCSITDAPWN
jgi:hypothetical protein